MSDNDNSTGERRYPLVYSLSVNMHVVPDGQTVEELRSKNLGGADAILVVSILYPQNGSLSVAFVSKDGRTDQEITDGELFKVWALLANKLATSPTLGAGRKGICADVDATIRKAVLQAVRQDLSKDKVR